MADYTFTNDVTGEKFAMDAKVFEWYRENPYAEFIKPVVRAEKKHKYYLEFDSYDRSKTKLWFKDYFEWSESRAEAVVSAIKSLMEYVQGTGDTSTPSQDLLIDADAARKALGDGV